MLRREIKIHGKWQKIERKYGSKKDLSMVRKTVHRTKNNDLLL